MSRRFQKNKQREKCLLEEDSLNYFRRISSVLGQGFTTDEERELFVENTLSELHEEPFTVFQDATSSRVIEKLVGIAHASGLRSLWTIFSKDWNTVCCDKIASHTLQKAILALPNIILDRLPNFSLKKLKTSDNEKEDEDSAVQSDSEACPEDDLIRMVLQLTDTVQASLRENLTHSYASHVIRALMQVLGGHHVDDRIMHSKNIRNMKKQDDQGKKDSRFTDYEVPKVFRKKFIGLCKAVFALEDFGVHLTDSHSSPVLQTLLIVLKKVNPTLCQKYILKVVKKSRIKDVSSESAEHVKLPPVIEDNVGSYLIEQIVALASQEVYSQLVDSLFKGRLLAIALHPIANFIGQKMILGCPDKATFTAIFDELSRHVEEVLAVNHCGVIVSLGEACLRLGFKQSEYLELLMKAFHCHEPEERHTAVVPLIAGLKTYEKIYTEDASCLTDDSKICDINYHGSRVLQAVFKFKQTKMVSRSLTNLRSKELKTLSCDPCGSHIIDAFIESSTVHEKFKNSLLNTMKEKFVDIACHKIGSRVIDQIWKHSNISQKALIATELAKKSQKVFTDSYGRYIHRNLHLSMFSERKQDWLELQGSFQKKRKLFGDIISIGADKKPAKRPKLSKDADAEEHMSTSEGESEADSEDESEADDNESEAESEAETGNNLLGDEEMSSSPSKHSPSQRGRGWGGDLHRDRGRGQRGDFHRGRGQQGDFQRGRGQRGDFHRGRGQRGDFQRGRGQGRSFQRGRGHEGDFQRGRGHRGGGPNQRGGSYRGHRGLGGSDRGHRGRGAGSPWTNNRDQDECQPTKQDESAPDAETKILSTANSEAQSHSTADTGAHSDTENVHPGDTTRSPSPNRYNPSHRGHGHRGDFPRGRGHRGDFQSGRGHRGDFHRGRGHRGDFHGGRGQRGGRNQRGGSHRGHRGRGGSDRGHRGRGGGKPWTNDRDKDKFSDRPRRGGFEKAQGGQRGQSRSENGPKEPDTRET